MYPPPQLKFASYATEASIDSTYQESNILLVSGGNSWFSFAVFGLDSFERVFQPFHVGVVIKLSELVGRREMHCLSDMVSSSCLNERESIRYIAFVNV